MLSVTDTRPFFRPLSAEIVAVLRALTAEDWVRPTVAGRWRVRDVVAHLLDTALRRLSFHRDGQMPAGPRRDAAGADLVGFINDINAIWIRAAERLSPRVLTDLYARAGAELADFMETLNLHDDAVFPVSWAGEARSAQWLDIGREFTEVWHHGAQIRDASGAGPFSDAAWLRAVLRIAMHALPHAYRDVPGRPGLSVLVEVTGAAGGAWTVFYAPDNRWDVEAGPRPAPSMTATMTDEVAWRLFFNALSLADAESLVRVEADASLAPPLLRARALVV